ncbi:LysM domain-containing protein [uncultured Arthrobacter sp.]|uniref:LysM peptidoglycan-binding domain-containing protein n=1 Tax=uncultured Arthrobacter sp. TaxID=114050 RepID=UPI0028D1A429|nr:LysM domain-containing protein [uncultured Arthrobacter sp.]
MRAEAALAVVILGLGVFLAFTGAGVVDHWSRSAARQQALLFDDLLGLLALAAGLTVIAWWLLSLALAFASALLERTGHNAAARAAGRFTPVFMRRLAMAAVGVQLLGAPIAHADALPAAALSSGNGSSLSAAWAPLPDKRPDLPAGHSKDSGVSGGSAAIGSELQPQWKPRVPVVEPGLVTSLPARATAGPAAARRELPVRAGDSLWTIAARELGPGASEVEIAARWPLWYQANRAVIGADPNVLLPGQLLSSPPP